ncbi:MAG: DUF4124 domain-containing protein [Desulfobacterales bacterium]
MKKTTISVLFILLWVCPVLAGENIYNWTDKNGIKRFSDQPPPQNVKQYKTIHVPPDQSSKQEPGADNRQGYDSMVENVKVETLQREQERVKEEASRAAEEKRKAESVMKAKIEAERQRLNERIDAINKRPMSRTYDQSFKQARINEIQRLLDKLNSSPDEYFQSQ